MGIGDRILHLRKDVLNLNQSDFANAMNISRSMISCLEKGERNATDRTISDLCRVFNVSEEWLRNGMGEMFQPLNDDIDYMIGKYGDRLTQGQKDIIIAMLQMNDDDRTIVDTFIDKLFALRNK